MRLLLDENMPGPSVRLLRNAGHDAAWIMEIAPGSSDAQVIVIARAQERLLVSFDRDFGDMIYRDGCPPPPGMIFFRIMPKSPEEPALLLLPSLSQPTLTWMGRFTVVEREQIRQRMLPHS